MRPAGRMGRALDRLCAALGFRIWLSLALFAVGIADALGKRRDDEPSDLSDRYPASLLSPPRSHDTTMARGEGAWLKGRGRKGAV